MKKFTVIALLALAPMVVHAECTVNDFKIEGFKVMVGKGGARPSMRMPGKLINNCSSPAAAQIQVEAKGADGSVIQAKKDWPAGTANINPGASADFDLGRRFHFRQGMESYKAEIVAVRTW